MKRFLSVVATAIMSLTAANIANAASYTETIIHHPESLFTNADGVNDKGYVVGGYIPVNFDAGDGYVFDGKNFVNFGLPNAQVRLLGINNNGDMIGSYTSLNTFDYHVFLYRGGALTSLDFPDAKFSNVLDINNSGQVLGTYSLDGKIDQYYLYESGKFNKLELQVPGAENTRLSGLNDNGNLVGSYSSTENRLENGFIYSDGKFTTVDHPLAEIGTVLTDINNSGQALGMYQSAEVFGVGFLYEDGDFRALPQFSDEQHYASINNEGQIVGTYLGTYNNDEVNLGFLLTPQEKVAVPEPSTVLLLVATLVGIFVSNRYRKDACIR